MGVWEKVQGKEAERKTLCTVNQVPRPSIEVLVNRPRLYLILHQENRMTVITLYGLYEVEAALRGHWGSLRTSGNPVGNVVKRSKAN